MRSERQVHRGRGQKFGAGLGAALGGWVLVAGGYSAGAATQSPGIIQAILALNVYIPLVIVVVIDVIVYFFRVERHMPEIQAYLARHLDADAAAQDAPEPV